MSILKQIFPNIGVKPRPSDSPEFRAEVEAARSCLERALIGLGDLRPYDGITGEYWERDYAAGDIVYRTQAGTRAAASVQVIGYYHKGIWTWEWASRSRDWRRDHARALREYGESKGYASLTTDRFRCSEAACWELTALALERGGTDGAIALPPWTPKGDQGLKFMTIGKPRAIVDQNRGLMETSNVISRNEIVGRLEQAVPDMWYLEGRFVPASSEAAHDFSCRASALDAKAVFSDPGRGIRAAIASTDGNGSRRR